MEKIKIVYIDDNPDEAISKYLDETYEKQIIQDLLIKKECREIPYDCKAGYESLLNNPIVREANVILIDFRLLKQENAEAGKFSGKQFKLILRKLFPFVEVIIITQNEEMDEYGIIRKYHSKTDGNPNEYYDSHLKPVLDAAIKEVVGFEMLADDLRKSQEVDKVLIDKILQSLDGNNDYDELKKSDIDNLIATFRELKDKCNG